MEQNASPAPALSCGIRLLRRLAASDCANLESLARLEGWPKSSTLRYLQAMELSGVVRQDPNTKLWHVLERLVPCTGWNDPLAVWRSRLPEVAEAVRHCTELYAVEGDRAILIDRADPILEGLQIMARIGFLRDLSELDATCQVYLAFAGRAAGLDIGHWVWHEGKRMELSREARDTRLIEVRASGQARDVDFNENGICRYALPVFEQGQLVGIFAVAQRLTPLWREESATIEKALHRWNIKENGI